MPGTGPSSAPAEGSNGQTAHQLFPDRKHGRRDAEGDGPLPARGHAAARELRGARARAGGVLVVRQLLARFIQERRVRASDQGAVPALRIALGAVRLLRQPALDQGGERRDDRGRREGPAQLREIHALLGQAKGRARLRRGDHLAPRDRRCLLGALAQALQRARAGRAGLLHRPHHGAAELAAPAQHRSSPGAGRNVGLHGARLPDRRGAEEIQVGSAILGQAGARMKRLLFLLTAVFMGTAWAQTYPSKAIRIIVPFTPGSATDVMARIVGERLNAAWGQPVVVENKPGAGGTIGIRDTARADPDGYTLVVVSSGHAVNHVLYKDLGYDTLKDLSAVAMLGSLPSVLIVPPTSPVKSVKELIAMLKASPGKYNYATAGVGSGAHVSLEKFNFAAGVKQVHVPLKGTPPILAETMGGRVDYAMVPAVSGMGPVRDGKVKPLAVTTSKRVAALPDVPTLGEAGLPDGESTFWLALLAPSKTPADIIGRLNSEVQRSLQAADMKERLAKLGTEPMSMSAAQSDAFIAREYNELGKIMRDAGLTPQ